jgi:hypothetical protein
LGFLFLGFVKKKKKKKATGRIGGKRGTALII